MQDALDPNVGQSEASAMEKNGVAIGSAQAEAGSNWSECTDHPTHLSSHNDWTAGFRVYHIQHESVMSGTDDCRDGEGGETRAFSLLVSTV
eukprot:6464484-Amphidinium_carterae.1